MPVLLEQLAEQQLPAADIRLAFFDVDGTLLDQQGRLSTVTQDAIARLHRQGIHTAFATGRPPFAVTQLQAQLALTSPGVFYTGAYCRTADSFLADHRLALGNLQPLIAEAEAAGFHLEGYYQDFYCATRDGAITREHAAHLAVSPRILAAHQWPAEPLYKLLLGADLRRQPQGLAALERAHPDVHFAYAHLPSEPHWQFASVVSAAVDKPALLQALAARLGLQARQVIAFGDGHSDCDFLATAGIGVAMGNAGDAVKAVADYVTRPSWADGVAYGLARLLRWH